MQRSGSDSQAQKEKNANASSGDILSAGLCAQSEGRKVRTWWLDASNQWKGVAWTKKGKEVDGLVGPWAVSAGHKLIGPESPVSSAIPTGNADLKNEASGHWKVTWHECERAMEESWFL